ncbi:MAG: hypothetical protein QXT53_05660 [Ignisphaera sp.]
MNKTGVFAIDGYIEKNKAIAFWIVFFTTAIGTWLFPFITALFIIDPLQPIWWSIACGTINTIATIWWIQASSRKPKG